MKTKGSTSMKIQGIPSVVRYLYEYSHGSADTPEDYEVEILSICQKGKDRFDTINRYDSLYPREGILDDIKREIINEHNNF